ncbi:MAG: sigma-70 family RNA polymerase sigma factor [Draconibacterium sp.]
MNGKKLIENCGKGNAKAQKVFYYRYVDILYATIQRYVKDSAEIDDILYQGLMKIFDDLKNFNYINEAALVGWLKKIVINESLMFLRADFRTIYKVEEISEIDTNSLTSDDQLAENDLTEIINQLPDGYRTVFLLHAVDGYSHKEIAQQLAIAEGTSRSQYFKARNLLQQRLKNDYGKEFGT